MRRAGSRQNSPTPQGPAQIPSHDLMAFGTSPVSPTTPLINLPSPASNPDWTFPKGYLRGFSAPQSSHLHRSGGQWLSSHVWSQLYRIRLDGATAQVPLPDRVPR